MQNLGIRYDNEYLYTWNIFLIRYRQKQKCYRKQNCRLLLSKVWLTHKNRRSDGYLSLPGVWGIFLVIFLFNFAAPLDPRMDCLIILYLCKSIVIRLLKEDNTTLKFRDLFALSEKLVLRNLVNFLPYFFLHWISWNSHIRDPLVLIIILDMENFPFLDSACEPINWIMSMYSLSFPISTLSKWIMGKKCVFGHFEGMVNHQL